MKRKTGSAKNAGTDEILWQFKSENKIQVWPKDDFQQYITPPSAIFPKQHLKWKNIACPPALPVNITLNGGVLAAGFSRHNSEYFVSHSGEPFFTYIVMLKGKYCAKTENKKYDICAKMGFLLPAKIPCDYFTRNSNFELIWFHIKPTSHWRSALGQKTLCRRLKYFEQFVFLFDLYRNELFSEKPELDYLQHAFALMMETVEREFSGDVPRKTPEKLSQKLEKFCRELPLKLSEKWTQKRAAARLGCTVRELDAAFSARHGKTFAKFLLGLRMADALKMLRAGKTVAEAARASGFSNAYAFSNSFKAFYGMSPRNYIAEIDGE